MSDYFIQEYIIAFRFNKLYGTQFETTAHQALKTLVLGNNRHALIYSFRLVMQTMYCCDSGSYSTTQRRGSAYDDLSDIFNNPDNSLRTNRAIDESWKYIQATGWLLLIDRDSALCNKNGDYLVRAYSLEREHVSDNKVNSHIAKIKKRIEHHHLMTI